jgi:putative flippase GtrA
MKIRFQAFALVGAVGFGVQLATIAALTAVNLPYLTATAAGVELAVLHNYWWHERWTWRDRAHGPNRLLRLARYHLATGLTSLAGNLLLTALFVEAANAPPVVANAAAVTLMGLVNFRISDRWIFAGRAVAVVALASASCLDASAAELRPETSAAWERYVRRFEATRLEDPDRRIALSGPEGEAIGVSGGTIHHWRAAVLIRGVTVAGLVDTLLQRGTPPPQEDVLEARLLGRRGNSLRVYLKLMRTALVTVTYDTEHEIAFSRGDTGAATSRSVATSIRETGGGDRGFLWRLNSYWRYVQVAEGVVVELESLSLSRSVPVLVRAVASPIISRVAREALTSTLQAMKRHFEGRDLDASLRQALPESRRQRGSTWSIAVDAQGLRFDREHGSIACDDRSLLDQPDCAPDNVGWIDQHAAIQSSRHERAIGLVRPVREGFRRHPQAVAAARFDQL